MSITTKALLGLVVLILGTLGWFYAGVIALVTPTSGAKIEKYANPRRALLVIDIQEDSTGITAKESSPFKNESATYIMAVNKIIEEAVKKDFVIVYIRQEFDGVRGKLISRITSDGVDIKGQPGSEIDQRVSIVSNNIFHKALSDAFSNQAFESFLVNQQVNELYLTGIDAEYCVYYTAKGALNRGYRVNLVTDGVAMAHKEKWDELMQKYKGDGVTLVKAGQL